MTTAAGSQIHTSSLDMTSRPRWLKNAPIPIGETTIGRQRKQYRASENGAKNAIPKPPEVIASRSPCDAVATKKKAQSRIALLLAASRRRAATAVATNASPAAKGREWERPR